MLSQRQRLNNFIERRWFEIGQPPLLRQHKYSILLRTIRREKRLVAMELIDLMLKDTSSRLGSMSHFVYPFQPICLLTVG